MSQLPPSICSSLLPFYPPTQPELKVTTPFLPPSTHRIPLLPPFPQGDFKPWTSMEKGREGEQENPDTSQQENKQSGRVQRETCAAPKIDENQLLYFQGEWCIEIPGFKSPTRQHGKCIAWEKEKKVHRPLNGSMVAMFCRGPCIWDAAGFWGPLWLLSSGINPDDVCAFTKARHIGASCIGWADNEVWAVSVSFTLLCQLFKGNKGEGRARQKSPGNCMIYMMGYVW